MRTGVQTRTRSSSVGIEDLAGEDLRPAVDGRQDREHPLVGLLELAEPSVPRRAVVGVLGVDGADDVGGEPETAHALDALGGVLGEVPPLTTADRVADHACVAHRDRESLADHRVAVACRIADEHRAVSERAVAPRLRARIGRARARDLTGRELVAERHAVDAAGLEERTCAIGPGEPMTARLADAHVHPHVPVVLTEPEDEAIRRAGREVEPLGHAVARHQQTREVVGRRLLLEPDVEDTPHDRRAPVGADDQPALDLPGRVVLSPADGRVVAERDVDVAHPPTDVGAGGDRLPAQHAAGLRMAQVQAPRDTRHHVADRDGRRLGLGRIDAVEVVDPCGDRLGSGIEERLLDAERACLGDAPRHHRLPADAVLVLLARLEHGDARPVACERGRERAAGDATAHDHHVGPAHRLPSSDVTSK